jgi:beta-glucanase (GH16 family)
MNVRAHLSITTATVTAAMLAATLSACSNPPSGRTGTAGTNGQGAAGDTASGASGSGAGTSGASGTAGAAGVTGASGSGAGTSGASGTSGTSGASGTVGTAGASGAAGTPDGGAGAGTAGAGGGTAGTGATACGTCPAGVEGHCDANATYPTYAGFTLAMVEDFCQPLDLKTDKIWTYSDGAPADGDTWFGKDQITFSNGQMKLTATPQAIPAGYTSYSESDFNSATGKPTGRHFLSGEFRTKYNNYRYGHYEVNYKTPVANPAMPTKGGYLSTMFLFRTPKWITWNEVDLELEPMDGTTSILKQVAGNVVNFANSGQGVPGYPGGAAFDADPMSPTYVQTDFHTYAVEWTTGGIKWFADGKNIHSYAGGNGNGGGTPKLPSLSAKIMMNLWVFAGPHFGDPTANVYPLVSTYESFRFYKATGETYPCTPTPSCISTDDAKFSKNNVDETTYP